MTRIPAAALLIAASIASSHLIAQSDDGRPSGRQSAVTGAALLDPVAAALSAMKKVSPDACTGDDGAIACNSSVSGMFGGPGDCTNDGFYIDIWRLAGTAGQTVTLTFSGTRPALLAIQDFDTGTILASRSGSSVLTLTYTFPSTRTYIVGLSYLAEFATGPYTLQASCSGGNTPGGSPNLTPYRPDGWSDRIVVSRVTGTNTDSANLTTADTLYVDFAIGNVGTGAGGTYNVDLFVDGVFRRRGFTDEPADPAYYFYWEDWSIGSLSAGTHTITIRADSTGTVAESNESDNEYTKTIVVSSVAPPPPPPPPAGCTATSTTACMLNGRFKVEVRYRAAFDNAGADSTARVKPVTGFANAAYETAFFYFNDANNIEMMVKLLDQGNTDSFGRRTIALLYGSATPLRVEITVTDTATGASKQYTSEFGGQKGQTDFTAFVK
jgi:hypothetical protein